MTAVERIEAAITKLEAERAAAFDGPWSTYETMMADTFVVDHRGFLREGVVAGPTYERANAALIVTLHRTIDAQIEILHDGIREFFRSSSEYPTDLFSSILALADDILGGES